MFKFYYDTTKYFTFTSITLKKITKYELPYS
jgi:hypothetical protein